MVRRDVSSQERSVEQAQERESGRHSECPECQGSLERIGSEKVCSSCALVVSTDRLDRGPEWSVFDSEEKERTGAPLTPTRHDRGLSTEIGYGSDANGTPLSGRKRRQLGRLRREQHRGRWRSKAERNLAHGLSEVRRIVSALELPDSIRDQACTLFRSAQDADLLRGRSIEAFAAAGVYATCRCNGLARTLEEVAAFAGCSRSGVENGYKILNVEFDLPTKPPVAPNFVPGLASDLGVSDTVRARAMSLAKKGQAVGLVNGCRPSGFAAACIYVASRERGEPLTQKAVASAAGVSPPTIRAHRDRLEDIMG